MNELADLPRHYTSFRRQVEMKLRMLANARQANGKLYKAGEGALTRAIAGSSEAGYRRGRVEHRSRISVETGNWCPARNLGIFLANNRERIESNETNQSKRIRNV